MDTDGKTRNGWRKDFMINGFIEYSVELAKEQSLEQNRGVDTFALEDGDGGLLTESEEEAKVIRGHVLAFFKNALFYKPPVKLVENF